MSYSHTVEVLVNGEQQQFLKVRSLEHADEAYTLFVKLWENHPGVVYIHVREYFKYIHDLNQYVKGVCIRDNTKEEYTDITPLC